jgi:hypothetical protein
MTRSDTIWQAITTDWFKEPVIDPPQFRFGLSNSELLFQAERSSPPHCTMEHSQGKFVEGLWEADVAEYFLCEQGSERYLEVNLAPTGAWWWCLFDGYRTRAKTQPLPPPSVKITSVLTQQGWKAAIALPLIALPITIDPSAPTRFNVTFALTKPRRQFLTEAPLVKATPDFHLVDQLEPRTFISLS